jgi:phosphoribosylaminoimidazolecarboxamide formyltransferase/IMP cyclohydrolase
MKRRAFLSVSDKTGVVGFARALCDLGFEIVSTGGTERAIRDGGVPVTNVSDITGFPECLDGRVKTLHPMVHAGILAMRDNPDHMAQLQALNVTPIDVVCVNLYPFRQTMLKPGVSFEECIENIDIGGPSMLRAAAKNHRDVAVVVDSGDYDIVIRELKLCGEVSMDTKRRLCHKVFAHTAAYDALIARYLARQTGAPALDQTLTLPYELVQSMRYGENPHQNAAFYGEADAPACSLVNAKQLGGKELSYNNIADANGALELLREFPTDGGFVTAVAVKHANPCGVASAKTCKQAYVKAFEADPVSIFGGIVAVNAEIDADTAKEMAKTFLEIVIAPSYTDQALAILTSKKNLRVLALPALLSPLPPDTLEMKKVIGGMLVQDYNAGFVQELRVVTKRQPTEDELRQLLMAWRIVKHVKSNGICLCKDDASAGVGPGQVNRIWAVEQAIGHAGERAKGAAMASDAFFPFEDCVLTAAKAGVSAIIHPGGSVRDEDSVRAADENNIAMVTTGMRHFKH